MIRTLLCLLAALTLLACGGADDTSSGPTETDTSPAAAEQSAGDEHESDEPPPEPTRVLADGSRLFGEDLSERDATELSTILGAPDAYAGQVVKTSGEISAVCQTMGCWMELRVDAESPGIRVPMANHAFFLPRDLAGTRATIEGTVSVTPLDDETRAHLESEGAEAADSEVSIEATGVVVHAG